jgi:hypothetical protein
MGTFTATFAGSFRAAARRRRSEDAASAVVSATPPVVSAPHADEGLGFFRGFWIAFPLAVAGWGVIALVVWATLRFV